jgi:hypothetical protein
MSPSLPPNDTVPTWLKPLNQLPPLAIDWLWEPWLPRGKLVIVDADPDMGKSFLTLDLCARLTSGRPFPFTDHAPPPAPVIILNGEDGARDTIRPRLLALGADESRVLVLDDIDPAQEPIRFPGHCGQLEEAIKRTGAQLVIIDPLVLFLESSVNVNHDQSVRRALLPLAQLAARYGCTILLVRHLNKQRGFHSLYRGSGAIGIIGACRVAWLLARDPTDSRRAVLAQVKNNLAARAGSLAFSIDATDGSPGTITWRGSSSLTANQLLAAVAKKPDPLPARDRAADFLKSALAKGPLTTRALWSQAKELRLSWRTIRRARKELDISSVRVWANGQRLNYWLLPGQTVPEGEPVDVPPGDLEEFLAPLRERFPPPNPLDDDP